MNTWITLLLFGVGLVLTIKGGDLFVDGARWLAEITGIPKFIIAATVVSLATTMPELLVSAMASVRGAYEMAMGNAIGSVACNTGLILGISVLFAPGAVERRSLMGKGLLMAFAAFFLMAFALDGQLSGWEAALLGVLVLLYVHHSLQAARGGREEASGQVERGARATAKNLCFFIFGAVGLVIGARLLVDNGEAIARMLGVPDTVIALTLVALGTSLPELVTTLTAIAKKEPSMSVGNIIGANTLDMTLVPAVSALVAPGNLQMTRPGVFLDLGASLLLFAVALVPAFGSGKFRRWQGAGLLGVYIVYLALRVF